MRLIFLFLMILFGSVVGAAAQVTNTPTVGGQGGGPFDDPCHPGDVMIGYNVTEGKALNTIAAVCQAQSNGVLVGANYGLATQGKQAQATGSYAGEDFPRCPAGQAIFGMTIWVNKYHELDSVAATCASLTPGGASSQLTRTATSGGEPVEEDSIGCGLGGIAVGIIGRSGALIDSLGLKCSPLPQQFVTVKAADDYFDRPAPPDNDPKKGTLAPGTAGVTVVQKGAPANPGWYQINFPNAPPGDNWIFTGDGCDCLTIPPQWQ